MLGKNYQLLVMSSNDLKSLQMMIMIIWYLKIDMGMIMMKGVDGMYGVSITGVPHDDEESDDEGVDESPKTKQGYVKDGFVV